MNQEPASGGSKVTKEPGAQVKSEQGRAKRQYQYLEGRDVVGIVMAVPIFLVGLGLALYGLHGLLYLGAGVILLLIFVGLIIPGKHYEWGITRVIGFAISALTTGVSVAFAVFAGWNLHYASQEQDNSFALFAFAAAILVLAGFGYAFGCTVVLFKKLEAETKQTVVTIVIGIAVGSLLVLLMYLLHFFE
jgi:hypothetical protein